MRWLSSSSSRAALPRRVNKTPMNKVNKVRGIATSLAAILLAGCASTSKVAAPASAPPPPPQAHVPLDASYDWHGLGIAPFGTLLKDIPLTLHEVLLFRDQGRGAAEAEEPECYGIDGAPPRFVGAVPDQYLLCFRHDRLARIEASVRLKADRAAQEFAEACSLWRKNAAVPGPDEAGTCEGHDGAVHFNAHLAEEPGQTDAAQTVPVLSITLDTTTDRH